MGRIGRSRTALMGAIVLGGLVVFPAAVGTAASPAAPPRPDKIVKPDAQIAKGVTGTPVGNDIYNTTGDGQAVIGSAKPGKRVTFVITIGNDGNTGSHLRVQAAGSSAGYGVKYLSGTTDVTADVVAGTFATGIVAPGGTEVLTVKVTVRASAAVGSKTSQVVTVTGAGPSPLTDAVRFTAKRK